MIRTFFSLGLALCFFSCAVVPKSAPTTANEEDLGIPENIAGQFAVESQKSKETKSPHSSAATPIPALLPVKSGKKEGTKKLVNVVKQEVNEKAKVEPKVSNPYVNRWSRAQPFFPGEKHAFDVTYFGTTAGNVELNVEPYKYIANREVFHIRGHAQSTSIFALFYRLNDLGESFFDREALFSHKFVIKLDETLQQRDLIELYDQSKHLLYYWQRLDHRSKGKSSEQFTKEIAPFTQDVLSALFYLRTLPLEVGRVFTFPVVSNGKPWDVEAHVIRREEINTKAGRFPAFVIKPITKFEGVLKTTGDSFIWISDDDHRAILKIDAKVKIGSVIAYLRELKYGQP